VDEAGINNNGGGQWPGDDQLGTEASDSDNGPDKRNCFKNWSFLKDAK